MELFKYIVKFIYRIRWWMVIFPCIAGIIAWFLTRNLEKTYDVKTTIFTGIISGYNVDATDTRNATVHMSNLMNIITTERTLKIVSLKLLAHCLHAVFEHTLDLVAVRRVGDEMVVAPCSKTRCGKEKRQKDFFHITIW